MLTPLVEKLARLRAINEAWLVVAAITLLSLCLAPFARRPTPPPAP